MRARRAAVILGGAVTYTAEQLATMSPQALHAYRVQAASTVKLPYVLIAVALIVLGIVISRFKLPQIAEAEGGHASEAGGGGGPPRCCAPGRARRARTTASGVIATW